MEPVGALFFLGRDIRFAIEKATDEAYWGDLVSPDYPALAKQVAAEKGLPISDEQAVQLWHTWNLGGVFLGRQLYPGVFETLQWLKEQGYRMGSVTNRALGGEPFREELRHHGVLDFFEALSISCEVGYLKPHPRIFEHALEALGVRAGRDGDGRRFPSRRRGGRQSAGHERGPEAEQPVGGGGGSGQGHGHAGGRRGSGRDAGGGAGLRDRPPPGADGAAHLWQRIGGRLAEAPL